MAMLKILKILLYPFIITATGCAADMHYQADHHHRQISKITETIKTSGIHEDCIELTPGLMLDHSFKSSKRLTSTSITIKIQILLFCNS